MTIKIYLDSCIFLALYYERNHPRTREIEKCLELWGKNKNIKLVTSDFTFTEFVKVGLDPKKISQDAIFKDLSDMTRRKKICNKFPFSLIEVGGTRDTYTFSDFFVEMQEALLFARPGISDVMHYVILKNNNIKRIFTTNEKDFKKFDDITVLTPNDCSPI
jgi:predicted nucleic acid-binding protein